MNKALWIAARSLLTKTTSLKELLLLIQLKTRPTERRKDKHKKNKI